MRRHEKIAAVLVVLALACLWVAGLLAVNASARFNRWPTVAPFSDKLNRIAMCESRMNWQTNTGNGFYGGLQFTLGTWHAVGGRGMPHRNTRAEQRYRAVLLYRRVGRWDSTASWPVCGRR